MYVWSVQTSKNRANQRVALKIMYSCKMKKNNFKQTNFENSKACYRLYVDYFKATFPYITPPIYENVQYYIERVL